MKMHLFQIFVPMALVGILVAGCSSKETPRETDTDTTPLDTGTIDNQFTDDPSVPQDCGQVDLLASEGRATTVGCEFYSTSLDVVQSNYQFAIVLANVNFTETAKFTVHGSEWDYSTNTGTWKELESGIIKPLTQRVIDNNVAYIHLNDNMDLYVKPERVTPKAILRKGAYKIVSDVPIIAYQFNPLNRSGSYSSDASMLMPVPVWSNKYQVVGYRTVEGLQAGYGPGFVQYNLAYFAVVATENNTEVTITPSATVRQGYTGWDSDEVEVPGGKDPFTVTLDEADVLYVHADVVGESLSGSIVETHADTPVALFSGHQCALIPEYASACDNVEEQLPGVEFWGTHFVAARLPNRNRTSHTDPVMWQIYAGKDNTHVEIEATASVKGITSKDFYLNQGEVKELYVYGSHLEPGDFGVKADQPIAVLQYMTGGQLAVDEEGVTLGVGDPTMSYLTPTAQFVSRYIVNIPQQWAADYLVVTRVKGEDVFVDGDKVDDNYFIPVPGGEEAVDYEVGRIMVPDGVHIVETGDTKKKIGLTVAGFDEYDSYAYTGGMGFSFVGIAD